MTTESSHTTAQSYGQRIRMQFFKSRRAKWSLRIVYVLLFIAVFADFIANEKPIYCQIEGIHYFPILHEYAENLGWTKKEKRFLRGEWQDYEYERVIFPPITYSPSSIDLYNKYKSPFEEQTIKASHFRHWLGTVDVGKDVAAGLVHGTRIAMMVGIIAMLIASIIGILMGALAGYFGDDGFELTRAKCWMGLFGILVGLLWGWWLPWNSILLAAEEEQFFIAFLKGIGILILSLILFFLLAKGLERSPFFSTKVSIPLDILVMRLIEVFNSVPTIFILLAIIAILEKSSIFHVMLVIGLLRWTRIARFIRSELLRIRSLGFIEASKAMGFSNVRILARHAIPNALTPVLITIAFGIAAAILLESALSFLGIGVGPDEMTWGKLLNYARMKTSAWWAAIFPGMAIFITVTVFNLIGDGLSDALDPNKHER